jgi:hypothetical protein
MAKVDGCGPWIAISFGRPISASGPKGEVTRFSANVRFVPISRNIESASSFANLVSAKQNVDMESSGVETGRGNSPIGVDERNFAVAETDAQTRKLRYHLSLRSRAREAGGFRRALRQTDRTGRLLADVDIFVFADCWSQVRGPTMELG